MSIQIICMIKNEEQVIEKFINHHIKIADNLLLIDNGSTDNTLNIIEKYPSVHLVQRHEHFSLKNDIFAEYIQNSNYELIIPLDADELLVYDDDKISCDDTNIIKNYLQELCSYNDTLFKIKNIYNYISDNIYKIETDHWRSQKFFFKKQDFISSCPGFHVVKTHNNNFYQTNISYMHFHYLNFDYWFNSSKQKMMSRLGNDWDNIEILKTYKGYSNHIAKELLNFFLTKEWLPK